MIRFLITLLLLHSLPFIHTQQASEYETVKPFYEQNVELTMSSTRLYRIDLADRQPDQDVALLALAYRGTAPQVFVAKTAEQLTSPDLAPYSSKDMTGEVLYIRQGDLNNEQSLYVKLVCEASECNAHVTFEYAKELIIEASGLKLHQNSDNLRGTTLGVVRVSLPQVADADRIVIHAEAIPSAHQLVAPQFDMLIEQGDKIPHTSRVQNIQRTSWFAGKTIVIPKDHPLFCATCTYTLSLKLSENISIVVSANVFGPNTNLTAVPILDGVQKDKYNSYAFNIHDPEDEFIIDVREQQGNLTLYIDCGANIHLGFQNYYWIYQVLPEEEIILTPKEHQKCQNSTYFIVAYGNEDSVYSIRALWKTSSSLELKSGSVTVGDIFPGETIPYEFLLPIFIADSFMIDIETDQALDIMMTGCKFPTDCPGLIPAQIEATPTGETPHQRNDSDFKFDMEELRGQNKRIIINPHDNGCYPILIKDRRFMNTPIPVCGYQLTLHSNQQFPVEYKLHLTLTGHEWLFPGLSKMDSVQKGASKHYMLYVPHEGLKNVGIQVTKFSGDVDVLVSKTEKYPNETTDDTQFSHEGLIMYKEAPLTGTYYITVKGEQMSSYSLSTYITTYEGEVEDYALELQEGVPQKGVLLPQHEHPVQFYKVSLDQEEGWEGSLRIMLNPQRGSIVMVVNSNNMIPFPASNTWNTTQHDLEIPSTDANFKRNGIYHIGLYMDWGAPGALGWDDLPFTIMYYLQEKGKEDGGVISNKNHLMLTPSVPFYGKIKKNEIKYFEVQVAPTDRSVTIYKQSDAGGVDLYVSREPSVEYPGPDNFTYTTALSHTNKLELTTYDIREICQESIVMVVCPFYMSVVPSSDLDETSFSLHIQRETRIPEPDATISLEDGKRLVFDVPEEESPALFHFYPHTREPTVVTVAAPGKHITIYAAKEQVEIGSSLSPDIEPPTPDSYAFSSKDNKVDTIGLAHLTIPSQDKLNGTIVAIAVYFQSVSSISNQYSIVASAHANHIYTGQPFYGAVQNDSYMYFNFDVSKDNCNILVALTTLDDGNPDLLVSYGADLRPVIGDAQFSSISDQRTEVIEISNLDILPVKSMAGTWSIGVYGRTASSFTLTVIYEDQKTVELKSGIPFEMLLSENSKMYFKYYHEENNDIEIRLDRFSGDLVAYVLNIGQNEEFQPNLPNSTYNDWTIDPEIQPSLKISTGDNESCTSCLYLIGLETKASSKFIISVNEAVSHVKLQNGIHYRQDLEPLSNRSYVFTSPNAEEVYMNVFLFGGEVRIYSSHNPTVNSTHHEIRNVLTISNPTEQVSIGKEDFQEGTISDGTREIPSQKNSFYFMFENPGTQPIRYSMIVRTQESNIILRQGDRADTYIGPKNTTSWVFYSSHDNELIKLIVDFHIQGQGVGDELKEMALEGVPVEGYYWAEKETQGDGKAVELERAKVIDDHDVHHILNFRQVITTTSKKGKYIFDITNPFDFMLVLGVRLIRAELGALTMEQNSEHVSTLEKGHSEEIEIFLGHRGVWYLWIYTCSGAIEVSVQDSSKELELESSIMVLPQGQEQIFKAYHPRGGVKTVTVTRSPSANEDTQFYLSSSYFFEEKVYDFEPDNDDYKAKVGYSNGMAEVFLTTVQFPELDATDRIIYTVHLCPYDEKNKEHERNVCGSASDCVENVKNFMVNNQPENVTAYFENVEYGNYYVKAVANIYHLEKLIKFVPYPLRTIEASAKSFLETEEESSKTGYILLGLLAVVVIGVLGYLAYGKLKGSKAQPGVAMQMQNFPPQKQKYEAVGGEEEPTIAEAGETSEEKSEEKAEEK